jgi:hypothetical protein
MIMAMCCGMASGFNNSFFFLFDPIHIFPFWILSGHELYSPCDQQHHTKNR